MDNLTWEPRAYYPDLRNAKEIAIDCETRDPQLKTYGAGWATGKGEVVGIAVATENFKAYYPIAHEEGGNLDKPTVLNWAKEQFKTDTPKVFANASYDVGWLLHHGIKCGGPWYDIQVAAPLIDEYKLSYSLDNLGKEYANETKDETLLIQAAAEYNIPLKKIKENIYRMHSKFVGGYAEQDAALTLKLWGILKPLLYADDLWNIFQLETDLIPVFLKMRLHGVRIDITRAEQVRDEFIKQENELQQELNLKVGHKIDVWSNKQLADLFEREKIPYQKTDKGNPSFTADILASYTDPWSAHVLKIRKTNRARTAYIENALLNHSQDGRIYCTFNPLKADTDDAQGLKGTVSGRISINNPGFQQVPIRHPVTGSLIRSMFIPDEGCLWASGDYSQQEPRLTIHYAALLKLQGAAEAVDAYIKNPDIDHHQLIADMAQLTGPTGRQLAKTINLGMSYCMGKAKLASKLGLSLENAQILFNQYHEHVPFIKQLINACSNTAANKGRIITLLGRKAHFDKYEPAEFGNKAFPVSKAEALLLRLDPANKDWFNRPIKRAKTYIALNRLIQGSAADMTKKAMLDVYNAGYLPCMQIHDELNFGNITKESEARDIKYLMENCVKLLLPIRCDMGVGANWAIAHGSEGTKIL